MLGPMTEVGLDPRVAGALIGALAVALGWLVTALRERAGVRRRRRQRERDVRMALAAEVKAYVAGLRDSDPLERWREVTTRMEAEPDYVPMVPSERADTVFTALARELPVLPEGAIDPVVRHYSHLAVIEAFVEDLRSERYRGLSHRDRIEMYTDYISLKLEARRFGEAAVAALRGVPPPDEEADEDAFGAAAEDAASETPAPPPSARRPRASSARPAPRLPGRGGRAG